MQITIEKNSACSQWIDIVELVEAQDVDVLDAKGQLAGQQFKLLLEQYQNRKPGHPAGVCWRWVLGLKDFSSDIHLMVMALPTSLDAIEANDTLSNDRTPGVVVASYKVGYMKFDLSGAHSPIPTLFSTDPAAALRSIKEDPFFIQRCLEILVSKLLVREELTAEQALLYLANPKPGETKQPMSEAWKKLSSKHRSPSKEKTPTVDKGILLNVTGIN